MKSKLCLRGRVGGVTSPPDHLIPINLSGRGFTHLPPIKAGLSDGETWVAASASSAPHVWLSVTDINGLTATFRLTAEQAWKLADQLRYLVRHDQADAAPEGAKDFPGTAGA